MKFSIRILWVILILIFSASCIAQGQSAGKLKISANKRFFTTADGKPFFWMGDTGWLLFGKLTREEAELYLEDRRKKGFNVIQVMVLHELTVVNEYGDSALSNKNVATPKITNGNNYRDSNQYDFWDHVDYVIDLAAKKNLYMALVPVWGTNVKNGGVRLADAKIYASWLANRYKSRPNIIWLNGGDIRGTDSTEIWKTVGNALRQNDPNHLITFHPFGRTTSSQYFHDEPWMDFNMFQSGHRSYELDTSLSEHRFGPDNYKFMLIDYNKKPTKPSFDGEPSYEEIPDGLHDFNKPRWKDRDVRRYGYWQLFAGGAGYTYGHNSVMQMHKPKDKSPAFGSKHYWDEAINHPGAKQMIHMKNLMLSKSYFDRVPDQNLLAGEQGLKYDYIAATRGTDYALFYDYTGRDFLVNMGRIKAAKVKATWLNPRDGSKQTIGTFGNTGVRAFNPPGEKSEGNDWILIIEKL